LDQLLKESKDKLEKEEEELYYKENKKVLENL
jgi:hypothetical protein